MKNETTLWIIDNEPIFTNGIQKILIDHGLNNILEFNSPIKALDALKLSESGPDLVLLDINMPEMNGVETAKELKKLSSDIKIIGLSSYKSEIIIANMLDAGVVAFLSKDSDLEVLYHTIDQVIQDGFYYSPTILGIINKRLMKSNVKNKSLFDENFLTKREKEILQLICLQKRTSEIAEQLFISERTVEGHRNNLLQKTESVNSIGLITFALKTGLIDLDFLEFSGNE